MGNLTVELGDGIEGLWSLPKESVRLILSDLPSGETCANFDKRPPLPEFWRAAIHALRPEGTAVLMASCFRFACDLLVSQSKLFRYELIYHKSLPTGFLNARKRPLRSHEFILVFAKGKGKYLYVPQMTYSDKQIPVITERSLTRGQSINYNTFTHSNHRAGAYDRFPRSVLTFNPRSDGKLHSHPQQKPTDMLRWIIRTYSLPNELVVDPFAGSGSTGHAAYVEGREFRGWDTNPRFAH